METIRVQVDLEFFNYMGEFLYEESYLPELRDVSNDRLLHLAAFCVSQVAIIQNEGGKSFCSEPRSLAAIDAVRQLSTIYEKMFNGSARTDAVIEIEGKSQPTKE
jgi:hypothetical protein